MPWKPHPHADARRKSAVALVTLLLQPCPDLLPEHRNECLKLALWKVTEAEGTSKLNTRYQSKGARAAAPGAKLQHDPVFQRAKMVDLLLAHPWDAEAILATAVGCTVTDAEHRRLDRFRSLDGWERYARAGIEVIDMKTGEPLTVSHT